MSVYGTVMSGGSISAVDGISVTGGSLTAAQNITSSDGDIAINPDSDGAFGNITAGGNISAAGGLFAPGDPAVITADGSISASAIIAGTVSAGTNLTVDNSAGFYQFGIIANTISVGGTLNLINAPTIMPDNAASDDTIGTTPYDFSLIAGSINSSGANIPLLFSNGGDATPDIANDNPGNGGHITLNLTAGGLTIAPTGDLSGIEARGGLYALDSTAGGDGGTIDITATGPVNVDDVIDASTGAAPSGTPMGNGGTVNITSADTVSVSSKIEASSNNFDSSPPRLSNKGGNIHLTSNKPTGVAINIANTGQLLALLDAAATGPGGTVTILATGAGSDANVKGNVQADRGTIDIRHTDQTAKFTWVATHRTR